MTPSAAAARLARPELAPLVDELARRFGAGDVPVSLSLRDLPVPTRRALADLLGADRLPAVRVRLPVARLLAQLGISSIDELRVLVEELRGPLPHRRAERQARAAEREELWAWVGDQLAAIRLGDEAVSSHSWLESLRTAGIRGGVHAYRARLGQAFTALRALPADGISLASLAVDSTGDPHALDHGRPLAGLVLDALAAAAGTTRADDAEGVRALWEQFGVAPDPLSSTVLALGLPGSGSPPGKWLSAAAFASEPVVLTLANLRRWPVTPLPADRCLYVVENPSLVAEAAARGWVARPPLVCSSGRPSIAVVTLLRQLTANGAIAYQHADFDPAGLAITDWLVRRAGTVPWRMGAADYFAALNGSRPVRTVTGAVPPTPWDAKLARALDRERVPVYEEAVRAALFDAMT